MSFWLTDYFVLSALVRLRRSLQFVSELSIDNLEDYFISLPACFGATQSASTEESLLCHFRRLDPSAQGLITGTAERLAAG